MKDGWIKPGRREEAKNVNLIIDIGNTRAKLVVFDGNDIVELSYSDAETLSELDALQQRHTIKRCILSTVARIGQEAEARLQAAGCPIVRLDSTTPLPVDLRWRRLGETDCQPMPAAMGADRIAAIVAGMCMRPGKPLLIVDAGTCITYEVIDDEGYYAGGNIAPGLQMRLKSMHEHTALLPLVDGRGETPLLGYDTETCMRSGAALGVQYEIEGYIRQWQARFPELHVFLTGGDQMTFNGIDTDILHQDNYLVPRGLNFILQGIGNE